MTAGRWRKPKALIAIAAIALIAVAALLLAVRPGDTLAQGRTISLTAGPGANGQPVTLDASVYTPTTGLPAPAVVLAHGFGGNKNDMEPLAQELVKNGYVAITYSARGFGRSGGEISLNSPQYEVKDAQLIVDWLSKDPDVLQDGASDPRVGFAGGSYGGALSLLVAGYDSRVDAIAPSITWNDLAQSLFPQFAEAADAPTVPTTPASVRPLPTSGVFKKLWSGLFFGSGASAGPGSTPTTCGRFAADVCRAYQQTAITGVPTPEIIKLMNASSPASVIGRIKAPTLLVQGQADSLFPLSEADANAAGIASNGTPVKVVWFDGGHDAAGTGTEQLQSLTLAWFNRYLMGDGSPADTAFQVTVPNAAISSESGRSTAKTEVAPGLPGVNTSGPVSTSTIPLTGGPQTAVSPAGGNPAILTSVPGLGSASSLIAGSLPDIGGQSARFDSAPLTTAVRAMGGSTIRLTVASSTRDATLFAKLYDVSPNGNQVVLPAQLVSPIRIMDLSPAGRPITVALPAVVHDFAAGHSMRVVVSSTDQGYQLPVDPRTYRISLTSAAGGGPPVLTVPIVATTPIDTGSAVWVWLAIGVVVLLAIGALILARWRARRREIAGGDPSLESVPLVISNLGKQYQDGFRAVSDVSFRIESGQVLGLLGPNGAGKTTILRMLMGLISPSEGEMRIFGHRVTPGAAVLSRVGAFVEGPGFLPHLSGMANLQSYWQATGRPITEAQLDLALGIAGLGEDINRKVRTYSQGMRQRLAIAQAMLGLPDLLVMDEPTNGLDPPQIAEMRDVLSAYAATGRTVLLSSHLLAEVEQTCSHVVVMDRGRVVAAGSVEQIVGETTSVIVDVDAPVLAARVARTVRGASEVLITGTGITLRLDGPSERADLVRALVEAGVGIDRITGKRGLEEAFLALVGQE
ncbi:MAG: alpha/beta fold hydrolase [Actinomycetes bacterium]